MNFKHGCDRKGFKTTEYATWNLMKERCYNQKHEKFPGYGKRGIRVCERWINNFAAFLADMGRRPTPKHSLNRKDNNGPYSPDNCCWSTAKEQSRNTRRNHRLTFSGLTLCIAEWAERTQIGYENIKNRINNLKWSARKALTQPVRPIKPRKVCHGSTRVRHKSQTA